MAQQLANILPIATKTMARLHSNGLSLVPLGGGKDGKSPLVRFKNTPRLSLTKVLGPMYGKGSACYGVRLDGLAVIDCDEDYPDLVNEMEARFGPSPVQVKTPRGLHLYYRPATGNYPNLRAEGLPVDIKRGGSSYTVGPMSVRSDGGEYVQVKGSLGETSLPALLTKARTTNLIIEGNRNRELTVAAIGMVETVDSADELFRNLIYLRDENCASPHSISDAELLGISNWAWSKRLEGNVYQGRNSQFGLQREAIDAIKRKPNASDAIALFVTLQGLHGHLPGKAFALQGEAMRAAGHTDLSRERFLAARRTLQSVGLLKVVSRHQAGKSAKTYRLSRILPSSGSAPNLVELVP